MVSKSFDINTSSLQPFEPSSKRLILELSPGSVSVILWNHDNRVPEAVETFKGTHDEVEDWQSMIQQSRLLGFKDLETVIVIAYPEMLLVPGHLYTPASARAQLELFFGENTAAFTSGDVLQQQEMVVAWQMPSTVNEFLKQHFAITRVKHLTSLLLQKQASLNAYAHVVLYEKIGWVWLWNDGVLQIAKAILFLKPEDLSWHLLNVCNQFGVEPSAVHWTVSGLAEESSPLWQAITRFFDPVEPMDAGIALQEELPKHYFAHLFAAL